MQKRIDQLIHDFKLTEARQLLTGLRIEAVPENERAEYSQLCLRAGLYRLGLQFMHAIVFESKSARPQDLFQYAACLRRVGLINEALRVLGRLPVSAKSYMQQAFCHTHHWNYALASDGLLHALEQNPTPTESRTIRVNLAASLVALEQFDAAKPWLDAVEEECKKDSFNHFLHCQELRVQNVGRAKRF